VPGADAIRIEGVVTAVSANGTLRVRFPNGHEVLGYLVGRDKRALDGFAPGQRATLEMSPYDFSRGRVLVEPEKRT
jgi:translation initiation factor IF-1